MRHAVVRSGEEWQAASWSLVIAHEFFSHQRCFGKRSVDLSHASSAASAASLATCSRAACTRFPLGIPRAFSMASHSLLEDGGLEPFSTLHTWSFVTPIAFPRSRCV